MASDATIVEVPRPPAGRLPFLLLILRMIGNPVASWSEDFYDEPIVVYRTLGLETVFVMDPELIQQILLDNSESFTKRPLYDHVLGGAGGKGLLIAEGERLALAKAYRCAPVQVRGVARPCARLRGGLKPLLARWSAAEPGSCRLIGRDMTTAAMQVLEDTMLGADLSAADRKMVADAAVGVPPAHAVEDRLGRAETARMDAASWQLAHAASEPAICAR